jgi:hypothetical protein
MRVPRRLAVTLVLGCTSPHVPEAPSDGAGAADARDPDAHVADAHGVVPPDAERADAERVDAVVADAYVHPDAGVDAPPDAAMLDAPPDTPIG